MTPKQVAIEIGAEAHATAAWQERAARPGYRLPSSNLRGRRVLTLESRRAPELALLVLNYGGRPVVAPALREVPLDSNFEALAFAEAVIRGEHDIVVLMTGVGTRLLVKVAEPLAGRVPFVEALAATRIVARGPKPVAALHELGITPWLIVPKPNTWHGVLTTLDSKAPGACAGGTRVAVQEYGAPNPELVHGLEARGAMVTSVPIYRWALPDDLAPIRMAVKAIADDTIDVMIVTAGIQLVHLLQVAEDMRMAAAVRRGLERVVVASIGPMTSEELRRQRVPIDIEASHHKMGSLVKEIADRCDEIARTRRWDRPMTQQV